MEKEEMSKLRAILYDTSSSQAGRQFSQLKTHANELPPHRLLQLPNPRRNLYCQNDRLATATATAATDACILRPVPEFILIKINQNYNQQNTQSFQYLINPISLPADCSFDYSPSFFLSRRRFFPRLSLPLPLSFAFSFSRFNSSCHNDN